MSTSVKLWAPSLWQFAEKLIKAILENNETSISLIYVPLSEQKNAHNFGDYREYVYSVHVCIILLCVWLATAGGTSDFLYLFFFFGQLDPVSPARCRQLEWWVSCLGGVTYSIHHLVIQVLVCCDCLSPVMFAGLVDQLGQLVPASSWEVSIPGQEVVGD